MRIFKDKAFGLECLRAVAASVFALLTVGWSARSVIADIDSRVTILETKQTENEKTISKQLDQIQEDLRELRSAVMSRGDK